MQNFSDTVHAIMNHLLCPVSKFTSNKSSCQCGIKSTFSNPTYTNYHLVNKSKLIQLCEIYHPRYIGWPSTCQSSYTSRSSHTQGNGSKLIHVQYRVIGIMEQRYLKLREPGPSRSWHSLSPHLNRVRNFNYNFFSR